jgi:hypothetical protein
MVDTHAAANVHFKCSKDHRRTIESFYLSLLHPHYVPIDHLPQHANLWYVRLYHRLLAEHSLFRLLRRPVSEHNRSKVLLWVQFCGTVLVLLFCTTVVTQVFLADDISARRLSLCSNNALGIGCHASSTAEVIILVVVLGAAVYIFACPIMWLMDRLVSRAAKFLKMCATSRKVGIDGVVVPLQNNNDELQYIQTLPATVMKGARLDKASATIDAVTPAMEVLLLASQCTTDKIAWQQHTVYGAMLSDKKGLPVRVLSARTQAESIYKTIQELHCAQDQDKCLMKHFIADLFVGSKRTEVENYLFGRTKSRVEVSTAVCATRFMCGCALLGMMVYMLYYMLSVGMLFSTATARVWLAIFLSALLLGLLLLQALLIWAKFAVGLPASYCGANCDRPPIEPEVAAVCMRLKAITKRVLRRTRGMLFHYSDAVQHFNPACRVAKMVPALPIARLLLSLCDYDLPLPKPPPSWLTVASTTAREILQQRILSGLHGSRRHSRVAPEPPPPPVGSWEVHWKRATPLRSASPYSDCSHDLLLNDLNALEEGAWANAAPRSSVTGDKRRYAMTHAEARALKQKSLLDQPAQSAVRCKPTLKGAVKMAHEHRCNTKKVVHFAIPSSHTTDSSSCEDYDLQTSHLTRQRRHSIADHALVIQDAEDSPSERKEQHRELTVPEAVERELQRQRLRMWEYEQFKEIGRAHV